MKKFALSLAVLGLSMIPAAASFADDSTTTIVTVDSDFYKTAIAEIQDKNCKVVRVREVCPYGKVKFEVHCLKEFNVVACVKDKKDESGNPPKPPKPGLTCKDNPTTNLCKVDIEHHKNNKIEIVIKGEHNGKIQLESHSPGVKCQY